MINKIELHNIFSKLREGDNSQFELLYKNYNQLVYKISFSILKNKESSEDVTQNVFAKIYSLPKDKLPTSKEATWLYAVTKNEALTFLRKERTNISLEEAYNIDTGKECDELQNIVDTEKYNKLINECNKKISILTALGDYSTKMNISSLDQDSNPQKVDFKELLKDFDSRIDSKLGLKLYSSTLPKIVNNSKQLQALGITMNPDSSSTKTKREKSGYVADFSGLYSNVLNIPIELQTMFVNEHQESIIGYSAHSNMPGKEANFMEVPSAYATRNMKIINNIGKSTFISNEKGSIKIANQITGYSYFK